MINILKNKSVIFSFAFILISIATLGSCKKADTINIAVCQIIDHEVFEQFKQGIIEGFEEEGYIDGKNIKLTFENAQGDVNLLQSIAKKLNDDKYDILIPMGTQPTQMLSSVIFDKPIIFCGVPDPIKSNVMLSFTSGKITCSKH